MWITAPVAPATETIHNLSTGYSPACPRGLHNLRRPRWLGMQANPHRLRAALLSIIRKQYDINNRTTGRGSSATAVRERCRRAPPYASDPVQRLAGNSGEQLTLTATDLEIQVASRSRLPQAGRRAGDHGVGAQAAGHSARPCRRAPRVALDLQDKRLQIKAGKSKFSLQTLPAQDFPKTGVSGRRERHAASWRRSELQAVAGAGPIRHGAAGYPLLSERVAAVACAQTA